MMHGLGPQNYGVCTTGGSRTPSSGTCGILIHNR